MPELFEKLLLLLRKKPIDLIINFGERKVEIKRKAKDLTAD